MATISLRAARATKYMEEFKESLTALKSIRTREIKQLTNELEIMNLYEGLKKSQRSKLYRSIDARLKWLKNLNRKICTLQTYLPRAILLLENLRENESEG